MLVDYVHLMINVLFLDGDKLETVTLYRRVRKSQNRS